MKKGSTPPKSAVVSDLHHHWLLNRKCIIKLADGIAQGIKNLAVEIDLSLSLLGEKPACVSFSKLHSPKVPLKKGNSKSLLGTLYLEKHYKLDSI